MIGVSLAAWSQAWLLNSVLRLYIISSYGVELVSTIQSWVLST